MDEGWDFEYQDYPSGGSSTGKSGSFRFVVPQPKDNPFTANLPREKRIKPATKRVLFISAIPTRIWMHSLFNVPGAKSMRETMCLRKLGNLKAECPACEEKIRLQYVGYFTVIDMGFVEYLPEGKIKLHGEHGRKDPDKVFQFQRRILAAKQGGTDKPGVLMTLKWEAEKRGGDLMGTVWDTTRGGGKTEAVGEQWSFVERVKPDDFIQYLTYYGAEEKFLNVERIDFKSEFHPMSYEEMASMLGHRSSEKSAPSGSGQRTAGATWEGGGGQNEAPKEEQTEMNWAGKPKAPEGASEESTGDDEVPF